LDIGVLGFFGIVLHKERPPEVNPFLLLHPVYTGKTRRPKTDGATVYKQILIGAILETGEGGQTTELSGEVQ
jgi:hypothetical protein